MPHRSDRQQELSDRQTEHRFPLSSTSQIIPRAYFNFIPVCVASRHRLNESVSAWEPSVRVLTVSMLCSNGRMKSLLTGFLASTDWLTAPLWNSRTIVDDGVANQSTSARNVTSRSLSLPCTGTSSQTKKHDNPLHRQQWLPWHQHHKLPVPGYTALRTQAPDSNEAVIHI